MFNKICVKDEYLIKVSFLKYSGLLDYLVYCFPPKYIGWKSADYSHRGSVAPTTWHPLSTKVGTLSSSGGLSVGIVCTQAQVTKFVCFV
jgi:hypothetical protein